MNEKIKQLIADNIKLRKALVGLVGLEEKEQLLITKGLLVAIAPKEEQASLFNAIDALIETKNIEQIPLEEFLH